MTRDEATDPKTEGQLAPGGGDPARDADSLAERFGQGTDLSEFDDLLDSLRDAMRSAEEDRVRGRKAGAEKRVVLQGQADAPEQAGNADADKAAMEERGSLKSQESQPPLASAEGEIDDEAEADAYPDWLTNGSASEIEMQDVIDTPTTPESASKTPRQPTLPGELEWPGDPYVDLPGTWEQPSLTKRRHVYRSYESSRVSAHAFRCRVTLSTNGHEYVGEAEGPSVPGVRAEIAAKATLEALCSAENGRVILALMTARVLRFSDMPLVVVSVYGMNDEEINRLVGVSVVENSEEQAAILATLQATDRWIAGVISRSQD